MIHGSSRDVGDELSMATPPLTFLDRLTRLNVNRLFTARSTHQFYWELTEAIVESDVMDLSGNRRQQQKIPKKIVIGIGAGKNYTLYDVGSDKTQFLQAGYQSKNGVKGFA